MADRHIAADSGQPYIHLLHLVLALLVVGAVGFGARLLTYKGVSEATIVTLTVTASSETAEFTLNPRRSYTWRVPPGLFSLAGSTQHKQCIAAGPDTECTMAAGGVLQVNGGGRVRVAIDASSQITMEVEPLSGADARFVLTDEAGNDVFTSSAALAYLSDPLAVPVRIPLVVDAVMLGANLHEAVLGGAFESDGWQPMLISGDVRIFASEGDDRRRYKVLDSRLDVGDVLHIGDATVQDDSESGEVWGVLSIQAHSNNALATPSMDMVLHTALPQVQVTRFGSHKGYSLGATNWTVVSRVPRWQATWVGIVSLILIVTFWAQMAQTLSLFRAPATDSAGGYDSAEAKEKRKDIAAAQDAEDKSNE